MKRKTVDVMIREIEELVCVRKIWRANAGWAMAFVEPSPFWERHRNPRLGDPRFSPDPGFVIYRYYPTLERCVRGEHRRVVVEGAYNDPNNVLDVHGRKISKTALARLEGNRRRLAKMVERLRSARSAVLAMALLAVGCGSQFETARLGLVEEQDGAVPVLPAPDAPAGRTGGSGGQAATGGATATGGSSQETGGSSQGTGGAFQETGGSSQETGGQPATGGAPPSTGGAPSSGGQADAGAGGSVATGGAPSTGGAPPSTGGAPATGGAGGCDPGVWPPEKVCAGACVSSDVMHGCQTSSCLPCPGPPANGVATCNPSSGFCSFVCFSGYHPAASASPMCVQ